jgi:hypothetical protein
MEMMTRVGIVACALLVMGGGTSGAQTAVPNQVTVPFSDPGRPGTVRVNLLRGSVNVKAASGRDVVVTTEAMRDVRVNGSNGRTGQRPDGDDPSAAGLRRLTPPSGVNIEEEANTITISASRMIDGSNVSVQVPAATSLVIRAVAGGDVTVEGVNGSIEINNVNGAIKLTDVGGPVIAHATNGRVVATLRQVPSGKPMSFTSFNGNVDVTLPASAKAALKLRSDRGDVYTDFDVQSTPAPASSSTQSSTQRDSRDRSDRDRDGKDKGKYRIEVDRSIYGNINGGGPDVELRTFNGNIYLRRAK